MSIASLMRRFNHLEGEVLRQRETIATLERKIIDTVRMGRVMEVDPKYGQVRVSWGKDENNQWVEGVWIPWTTRAGKIKTWNPPSVGEQVMIISPGGDIGAANSWCQPGGYSDLNKQNHDADGEWRHSVGSSEIHMKDGELTIKAKKFNLVTEETNLKANTINNSQKGSEEEKPTPVPEPSVPPRSDDPPTGEVPTS